MTEDDLDEQSPPQLQFKPKTKRAERLPQPKDEADHIILKDGANVRFERWMQAISTRFEGFGKISKNDLADFLFRKHSEDLSEEELIEIGNEIYDEVHWLNWALEKITNSKIEGVALTLEKLLARKNEVTAYPTQLPHKTVKRAKTRAPAVEKTFASLESNPDETEIV